MDGCTCISRRHVDNEDTCKVEVVEDTRKVEVVKGRIPLPPVDSSTYGTPVAVNAYAAEPPGESA